MKIRKMLALITALSMLFSMTGVYAAEEKAAAEPVAVIGTQSVVIEGFDWGLAYPKPS